MSQSFCGASSRASFDELYLPSKHASSIHARREGMIRADGRVFGLIWKDFLSSMSGGCSGKGGGRPEATDEPGCFDDESL